MVAHRPTAIAHCRSGGSSLQRSPIRRARTAATVRGGGSPRDAADDGDAEAEGEDDEDDESDEDDDELWDPMHGRLPDAPRRQSRGAAGGDGGSDEDTLGEEASSSDPHLLRRLVREARAEDEGDEQQQPDEEDEPRMISAPRPAPPLDHIESAARGGGRFCVRTTRALRATPAA